MTDPTWLFFIEAEFELQLPFDKDHSNDNIVNMFRRMSAEEVRARSQERANGRKSFDA